MGNNGKNILYSYYKRVNVFGCLYLFLSLLEVLIGFVLEWIFFFWVSCLV